MIENPPLTPAAKVRPMPIVPRTDFSNLDTRGSG